MARTIYYGVFGEGHGHVSRCLAVSPWLLAAGHRVCIFCSERSAPLLRQALPHSEVTPLRQFRFRYADNALKWGRTLAGYAGVWAWGPRQWRRLCDRAQADRPSAVIADYDWMLAGLGRRLRLPVLALDHQQVVSECAVAARATAPWCLQAVRLANRWTYGRPTQRLVSSFFRAPWRRPSRTPRELVGAIHRGAVLEREARRGEAVVVYQTSPTLGGLDRLLNALPGDKIVYGAGIGSRRGVDVRPFEPERFLDELAACRFAVVNGGHTAIAEALYYGKPVLCVPVARHAEQEINAHYTQAMGVGVRASANNGVREARFFVRNEERLRERAEAAARQFGNAAAQRCVLAFAGGAG